MSREKAIKSYIAEFGWFPFFLFMGAADEKVIEAVQAALESGREIQPEIKEGIY